MTDPDPSSINQLEIGSPEHVETIRHRLTKLQLLKRATIKHGTLDAYFNKGCRCPKCSETGSSYRKSAHHHGPNPGPSDNTWYRRQERDSHGRFGSYEEPLEDEQTTEGTEHGD